MEASAKDSTMLETRGEQFAYLHTSYVVPASILVVEVVVNKIVGHNKTQASAGFCVLDIFGTGLKGGLQTGIITSGSPRGVGMFDSN